MQKSKKYVDKFYSSRKFHLREFKIISLILKLQIESFQAGGGFHCVTLDTRRRHA